MQYDRAGQHYWDSVAKLTDQRWNWQEVLETFRSIENHELGASPVRGDSGPLSIKVTRDPEPLNEALIEAAKAWGLPWTDDLNSHDGERFGFIPNTTKNGFRHSTSRAFLSIARKKRTVTHQHHAHAVKLHFDGKRATAVETLVKKRAAESGPVPLIQTLHDGLGRCQLRSRSGTRNQWSRLLVNASHRKLHPRHQHGPVRTTSYRCPLSRR